MSEIILIFITWVWLLGLTFDTIIEAKRSAALDQRLTNLEETLRNLNSGADQPSSATQTKILHG